MALINVSVYCLNSKRMLLSWRIMSADGPDTIFETFLGEKTEASYYP